MSKIDLEERVYRRKIMYLSFGIASLFVIVLSLVASKTFVYHISNSPQEPYLERYENGKL